MLFGDSDEGKVSPPHRGRKEKGKTMVVQERRIVGWCEGLTLRRKDEIHNGNFMLASSKKRPRAYCRQGKSWHSCLSYRAVQRSIEKKPRLELLAPLAYIKDSQAVMGRARTCEGGNESCQASRTGE